MTHRFPLSVLVAALALLASLGGCRKAPPETLSPVMLEMLTQALQEERYAEALYTRILSEYEAPDAFVRAVEKETAHSAKLERLYRARGLAVPASEWTAATVPSHATLQDACRAALQLEQGNVARYDVLLEMWGNELPVDLRNAFTTFRRESEQQHLPIVRACAEG